MGEKQGLKPGHCMLFPLPLSKSCKIGNCIKGREGTTRVERTPSLDMNRENVHSTPNDKNEKVTNVELGHVKETFSDDKSRLNSLVYHKASECKHCEKWF